MKRTEVSAELRAVLWNYIYSEFERTSERETFTYVGEPWLTALRNIHVYFDHRPRDEFNSRFKDATDTVKRVFTRGDYLLIYGWLQHVLRARKIRTSANASTPS